MKSNLSSNNQNHIRQLFLKVSNVMKDQDLSSHFNWSEDQIHYAMENYSFYFQELDGPAEKIRSFICFQQTTDQIEILALGVDPDFQNQGSMGRLLKSFISEASGFEIFLLFYLYSAGNN